MIVRLCLCLSLLATGALAVPSGPAPGLTVKPGEVALALSPVRPSYLPIDLEATVEGVCQGRAHIAPMPLGECRLKVVIPTGMPNPPIGFGVTGDPGGGTRWRATALALAADAPIPSSCGTWTASFGLDTVGSQPLSPLALQAVAGDPARGAFASALTVRASLHLANLDTGQTADLPLALALDMAGSWARASAVESAALAATESDLIPFVDREGGELERRGDCIAVRYLEGCVESILPGYTLECSFCLESAASAVGIHPSN